VVGGEIAAPAHGEEPGNADDPTLFHAPASNGNILSGFDYIPGKADLWPRPIFVKPRRRAPRRPYNP
jgi:hypothetical protein